MSINLTPKEFGDLFFGPDDERKEKCIHCGYEWYSKHYKDGVCNSCQKKGLEGRTVIERRKARREMVAKAVLLGLPFGLLVMFLKLLFS